MTMNKSDMNHKIDTKNHYKKRKKGTFEDGFAHHPNGDAGRNKRNRFSELNKRDDLKVHMKKMTHQRKFDQTHQKCEFAFYFSFLLM